jgi:hypothetical protein
MAQDRPDATHDGDGTHDGVIRTPMDGDVPLRALAYPYGGRGLLHRRGGGSVKEVLFWVVVCFLFLLATACAIFGAFVRRGEHRYLSWAAWVGWAVLCVALGLVLSTRFS